MACYLDHAATTPVRPEAIAAMRPYLRDEFANPSGAHAPARRARRALDDAREVLAELVGAQPGEIVFCSGGTEADNLAVFGVAGHEPVDAVCSAVEHHAVLDPVAALGGRTVAVGPEGIVDLDALAAALGPDTGLVSVMAVNNETGAIQPLDQVAEVVREHAPGAVLHTDAVQAFEWLDVSLLTSRADLVSYSAHKFGGPKGVGLLVVREGVDLSPLLLGGGQERGRRSGTQNVPGIVGMAAAAQASAAGRRSRVERVAVLRDRLVDGLVESVPDCHETGVTDRDRRERIAGTAHVCVAGVESEELLFLLEKAEVYASAASSCSSGAMEPSHVLAAMAVPPELAGGALRLSLGEETTHAHVDAALAAIPPAVERLRLFATGASA